MTVWAQSQAARMVREAIADEERRVAQRRTAERAGGRRTEDMVEVSQMTCPRNTESAPTVHVPEAT